MTPNQLDTVYSALCEAMARVGKEKAPVFLGALSLSLLVRVIEPELAQELIEQAERACGE